MHNPCKPDFFFFVIYCHSYCVDYKLWKHKREKHRKQNIGENEYLDYVKGAIKRMKGGYR